jgi:hypothetical protein
MATVDKPKITATTPNPNCPACISGVRHDEISRRLHPLMGHGYTKETGWTCEAARKAAEGRA